MDDADKVAQMSAPWCGRPLPDDRDGWKARAMAFKESADEAERRQQVYRDVLAKIVGAFTSGIYCANCGEGIETCRCIIDLARTALAD